MKSDVATIRSALDDDPDSQALQMSLARLLIDDAWANYSDDKWIDNYFEARAIYELILATCPDNEVAIVNLGVVLSDRGQHQQALHQYQMAQNLGWEDANLEFNIGVALVNLHDDKQGIKHIKASHTKTKHEDTLQAYFDPQAY